MAGNGLNQQQLQQLTARYAAQQNIDPQALTQQMQRWQPWLRLLMASWYELRWQQTQNRCFTRWQQGSLAAGVFRLRGEVWVR